jgi:hypothetical protein
MFRVLSIVIIIGSIIWLYRFFNNKKISFSEVVSGYFTTLIKSISSVKFFKSHSFLDNLTLLKRIVYLFTLFLFFIMAISAFIPIILFGDGLGGLFLLLHVSVAPLFSVFLATLIILFAHSNRFNNNDLDNSKQKGRFIFNQMGYIKISFWFIVLFSIPLMISVILSMFPLFGTEGQLYLLEIHRYCSLIIIILVILHSGLITVNQKLNFNK